jgi:F420-dependent oxidoreductase-like protein
MRTELMRLSGITRDPQRRRGPSDAASRIDAPAAEPLFRVRSAVMKVGLQICSFTWPGGPEAIGPTLARIARQADDVGFDSIWVMDHFFQIRSVGRVDEPMLEGMTALGFMAAHTERARLGLMVGGVHYRDPGLWIKATTTLDVLSGGRAWLGIGAAWNEEESRALGFDFPPLGVRFELLEDTLRMAHGMWAGERGSEASLDGRHLHATRLLNAPQSISRPRPPIMVGGGGERKTLRLVARYADACNVFGRPEAIARKFAILEQHCADVGRDPAEIERTTLQNVRLGPAGRAGVETPAQVVDRFGELSDAGAEHVVFELKDVHEPAYLETVGRDILPALQALP